MKLFWYCHLVSVGKFTNLVIFQLLARLQDNGLNVIMLITKEVAFLTLCRCLLVFTYIHGRFKQMS